MIEEEQKIYQQNMRCENCGHTFIRDFEKGNYCGGFYKCPNCGCNEAKAKGNPAHSEEKYEE